MKRLLIALIIFSFLGFIAASTAWLWLGTAVSAPGPGLVDQRVVITPGSSVNSIARKLREAGIIKSDLVFRIKARLSNAHTQLQAGEYDIGAHISIDGLMTLLKSGNTVVRRLTVPEGLRVLDVLERVARAEGLKGDVERVPGEGRLLPETYHYSWGDGRDDLVARMELDMDVLLGDLWAGRTDDFPLKNAQQVLVLASIVEKETSIASERAHVAAVFLNRLKRGMRLQSDPTVVYAITRGLAELGRSLTRQDLGFDSPYNTYRIKGLPPEPIANPGRAAIQAVMKPLVTRDLYFVADGKGGHVFARTLAEHNKNVSAWRRAQRKAGSKPN